jgi:hypothetical protein
MDIPNVVHLFSCDRITLAGPNGPVSASYAVWEYVPPGRSLTQYLEAHQFVPAGLIFSVLSTILRVLHDLRQRGLPQHGNLHGGNIFIREDTSIATDRGVRPDAPIYVADCCCPQPSGGDPSDDYEALAAIADSLFEKAEWTSSNSSDRKLLEAVQRALRKTLIESTASERVTFGTLLQTLLEIRDHVSANELHSDSGIDAGAKVQANERGMSVGQYQVSEMLGDNWDLWRRLFVPAVPARSHILEKDITTVITGPRGCGKTMLFRRLSERVVVECGPVDSLTTESHFVGFYVNGNDFADGFPRFPATPDAEHAGRLTCFAHLCILADVLAVEAVWARSASRAASAGLIGLLEDWFGDCGKRTPVVAGEDRLSRYRSEIELLKREFLRRHPDFTFPAYDELAHHGWLKTLIPLLRNTCPWIGRRTVFFFIDDYTTPRVSVSMQRVLNRVLFQRSDQFVVKIATEAATTFVAEDSSGKQLQNGDDFRLIDMGEESLFMTDEERRSFLNQVFRRRLKLDKRVSTNLRSLPTLLGKHKYSKTAFARLLREPEALTEPDTESRKGILRGAVKRKALYFGHDVFACLWSGDTRLMIQLIQDLVDEACTANSRPVTGEIASELQDRVFRNRGSQWLEMQVRNQPTDAKRFELLLTKHKSQAPYFQLAGGTFGQHLKAVVEAFKDAARFELMGPVYVIENGGNRREVPKMAFRIEVVDDFRVDGLAAEIYRDLLRYGLFMRDARGKSVRGAMVPRLYLRRLLLPYCLLPLSKRDSVQMNCDWFIRLLLQPDEFKLQWLAHRRRALNGGTEQISFDLGQNGAGESPNPYNDLEGDET